MPARRIAARLVGVVGPYEGPWTRAITSAADAALRTGLLRTLHTPDVRGRAALALLVLVGPDAPRHLWARYRDRVKMHSSKRATRTGFCTSSAILAAQTVCYGCAPV
jgi:hypothetical protein